jgi:iron complex outermembrane recepter protein
LKKAFIVLLALHASVFATAQEVCDGEFSGRILDKGNQPLIGAAIVLLPQRVGQNTDGSGNFRFERLCPGRYTVKVQYIGYQDTEFQLQISGQVSRLIHMEQIVTELNEVVIRHHDADHTEHASNFVKLGEKQLAESAGKSLGESLKVLSGVNSIQTGPGIFKPVIHGLHSQRILILNYGIRQEGQQWGSEHAPEIDPFIASNIVVIKDASAIKYGTDALGGVIVVNPASLPENATLGGTFNTVLQSNGRSGTLSGMLEGGIRGREGWGWRVQGTGKKSGDFRTPDYHLTNTGIEELNFSASTGYHKKNKGFDIFFSHFQTEVGMLMGTSIGNLDDLVTAMETEVPLYTTDFSYDIQEPRQEASHNLLKLNGHLLTKSGEWRLQYGFQNNNRREFHIRRSGLSKLPAIDLQLNTHTIDGEWETQHSEHRTMTFGVNGMLQNNRNIPGTQRVPFIPNFTSASAGVFGITKFFLEKWTLDIGARYDYRHYSVKGYDFKNTFYQTSLNFNNFSASFGVTHRLNEKQIVNLNLSSAWRPPHVSELYSMGTHQSAGAIEYGLLLNDTTNEIMDISDVNFKTEQAIKFVATYQLKRKEVSVEISPFANYISNYIYLRPVGITRNLSGVYPYVRYGQTNALFAGLDMTATWRVGKYVALSPRASLLRAGDETNDDFLVFIPPNRYELAVRFEKPSLSATRNFYVESRVKFVAKQNRAPRVVTVPEIVQAQDEERNIFESDSSAFDFKPAPESFWLLDVSTGVSFKTRNIQYDVRLSSENTLDQQYRDYTNRLRYYSDEVGRNIVLSLKCIF